MWEKKFIETTRGEFELFIAGSGEPLCVTHLYSEFNERGNYFADRFVNSFTVFLVNLKEAGNSPRVNDNHELSMSETTEDLEAIRVALGFDQWSFAGHSTGGMLGLVYAAKHDKSLNRLLVVGASATNDYIEHPDSIYSYKNSSNSRLKEIFSILKSDEVSIEEKIRARREWTEMSLYEPNHYDDYFSIPSSGKLVQKRLDYYSYNELPDYDIRDDLSIIKTPTMVFCGRHDSQCPLFYSEEIHNLITNSKLHVFEASNHFPHLEEKEKFTQLVKVFSD